MSTVAQTAILLAAEDAAAFLVERPAAARIVTMAPVPRAALEAAGLQATSSDRLYSDRAHARAAVRMRRAERYLARVTSQGSLDPAAAELLRILYLEVAASAAGAWELLRATPGPWCVRASGTWRVFEVREEAHRGLMQGFADDFYRLKKNRYVYPITPMSLVARLLFTTATLLARSRGTVLLHETRRGLDRVGKAIEQRERADVLSMGFSPKSWRSFVRKQLDLVRGVRQGLRLMPPLRMHEPTRAAVLAALRSLQNDAVVRRGAEAFADLMARSCGQTVALVNDVTPALKRLQTRSVLTWDMSSPKTIAYAHAGRRAGARVFVASHTTIAMPAESAAQPAGRFRAAATTAGEAADAVIAQSPTVAAAARSVAPHLPQVKATPFLWRDPPAPSMSLPTEPALFLWAGNFARWIKHRPFIDETPDETLDAVIRFAQAIIRTPGTALEIRVKPNWRIKGDIDEAVLRRYVPRHERVVITAEGTFGHSLSRATAVVTHSSTALEEAFRARVPVVLWGARGRVHFVQGQSEPPTEARRAAVYTPSWDGGLDGVLAGIAQVHRGRPLTDAEVAGLVWPEASLGIDGVARILARPDTAPELSAAGEPRHSGAAV